MYFMPMRLSVAHTFAPGLLQELSKFPEVREVYGKMDPDVIGGGRSSYTLPAIGKSDIHRAVQEASKVGIAFNYLINAANLQGLEQTRKGQKQIRTLLDFLSEAGIRDVTLASPYLLRMVKAQYPHFKVRVGVFAVIDSPVKAQEWEGYGADTLCVSATSCNRDFRRLRAIREAVRCDLQLIVNASCIPHCAYELTHMDLLTQSSTRGDSLKGFCLDYCFLNCSAKKLRNPVHFIRSIWIRPEDLALYEEIGYDYFKILERSCPAPLLMKRVEAYVKRRFEGNLFELVGPVAQLKKAQGATLRKRFKTIRTLLRPWVMKMSSLALMKRYAETIIQTGYEPADGVYVDNRKLDGFLDQLIRVGCTNGECLGCGLCEKMALSCVTIPDSFRAPALNMASQLEEGLHQGTHWFS